MKKLSRIYIEITNVCNLACSFCIGNIRAPRFMSRDEFASVLQQVSAFTGHIYLHVLGEPLLHPQLEEFLAMAQQAGLHVNLTTNGTLLAQAQEMLLRAPALRKVSISLHSMEPDSPHDTRSYLCDAAAFALACTKAGKLCELRLWNLGAQENENESIFTAICTLLGLDESAQREAHARICEIGSITLAPCLFLGTDVRFAWPSLAAPRTEQPVFCHGLRSQAAILSDGTVVPCCLDSRGDITLGNIFCTPLAEILSGERAQALYDGFSKRRPSEELCRRCGYATRFTK